MRLSAIIINYETPEMTLRAIDALAADASGFELELILIENSSRQRVDRSGLNIKNLIIIENDKNIGFAPAVNQGLKAATGEAVLLLNSDVLLASGSLARLADFLQEHQAAGIVGPKMVFPDGRLQYSCGSFPNILSELIFLSHLYKSLPGGRLAGKNIFTQKMFMRPTRVDWISGGCMLIKRELIDKLGLLDDEYFFGIEDIDYCLQAARAGYEVYYCPDTSVVHYHAYSLKSSGLHPILDRAVMERKSWQHYFKKNFSQDSFTPAVFDLLYRIRSFFLKLILSPKQ